MRAVTLNVLMPVFNEALYIKDSIESVLNYDYGLGLCVRVVVVDDFSTDNTKLIVDALVSKYPNKLFSLSNSEKGKNNGFNYAWNYAAADFYCFLGGDDIIIPKIIEERVAALMSFLNGRSPDDVRVFAAMKMLTFSKVKRYDGILIPKNKSKGSLSGGSLMLSSALMRDIFPIPTNFPNEDTWIGLYIKYFDIDAVHIPKVGLRYRIHDGNSHKRGDSYENYRYSMWIRARAVLFFYVKYNEDFDKKIEKKIITEVFSSCATYIRDSGAILFSFNLGFFEKIKQLTLSSKVFYVVKQKFYKFIAGR